MTEQAPKLIEFAPRDAAKDLIRVYVERGDSLESLTSSLMGYWGSRYRAQIGGYLDAGERSLRNDQIGVLEVQGVPCKAIFPLRELYDEIKAEQAGTPTQQRLL